MATAFVYFTHLERLRQKCSFEATPSVSSTDRFDESIRQAEPRLQKCRERDDGAAYRSTKTVQQHSHAQIGHEETSRRHYTPIASFSRVISPSLSRRTQVTFVS